MAPVKNEVKTNHLVYIVPRWYERESNLCWLSTKIIFVRAWYWRENFKSAVVQISAVFGTRCTTRRDNQLLHGDCFSLLIFTLVYPKLYLVCEIKNYYFISVYDFAFIKQLTELILKWPWLLKANSIAICGCLKCSFSSPLLFGFCQIFD